MNPIVELAAVTKAYQLGKQVVTALRGIDFKVGGGEFAVIAGPSGSGKTTLLNLIGCMDVPTSGTVRFDGQSLTELSDRELTILRRDKLGYIFQSFNLMPVFDAFHNIE